MQLSVLLGVYPQKSVLQKEGVWGGIPRGKEKKRRGGGGGGVIQREKQDESKEEQLRVTYGAG